MAKIKNSSTPILAEDSQTATGTIIGTYEGECADANITNLNGLDITREVWENVFESDDYKQAIDRGWYIGFLGHPQEDADCQDFRRACIVMTEGHIDDNGKVYGKFNLIDTPVGRIVKAFQDAGVIFGISVRGAGDIVNNSVDPDTFVFRGFDLVTFPAFPKSIPKFTAIAASTDAKQRKKYQAVCAAVKVGIPDLTASAIEVVQPCFAKQSDEYQALEARKAEILGEDLSLSQLPAPDTDHQCALEAAGVSNCEDEQCIDPRVDAMTKLYLELKCKYDELKNMYDASIFKCDQVLSDSRKHLKSVERICTSQMNDLSSMLESIEGSLRVKTDEARSLRSQLNRAETRYNKMKNIQGSIATKDQKITELESRLRRVQASLDAANEGNRDLSMRLRDVSRENRQLKTDNLKYIERVEAANKAIESKDAIISSTKSKLDETVRQQTLEQQRSSNRDDQMVSMKSRVEAAETLTRSYQDAYANLYANAIGVRLPKLNVTANTDVDSLQKMIRSSTSIAVKPDILEPTQDVDPSYFDVTELDEDELVTV